MSEQRLGILGGMGPQATQDFYQRILDRTDASCDQEHLPTLIWSDTSMPDRTAAILGGDAFILLKNVAMPIATVSSNVLRTNPFL